MTPFPSQSILVLTARGGARPCHPSIIQPDLPANEWRCQSRRLGVTSSTGARTAALLAGGSKAAVAEET